MTSHQEDDCTYIAQHHYGLKGCELLHCIVRRKNHYVMRAKVDTKVGAKAERFILTSAPTDGHRLPYERQFDVMYAMNAAGFWQVRLPYRSIDGKLFVVRNGRWYTLRWFAPSDQDVEWQSPGMVYEAAQTLAAFHDAAGRARLMLPPSLDPDLLAPFHWNVDEIIRRVADAGLEDFRGGRRLTLASRMCLRSRYLGRAVHRLQDEAGAVLAVAKSLDLEGLTHQDFYPDNLRVHRGKVMEVLDWDLARIDHTLYDVAVTFLLFAWPGRLHSPERSLVSAEASPIALNFARWYVMGREGGAGTTELRSVIPALLPWYLRYAVIKRILVSKNPCSRIDLLRSVEAAPVCGQRALERALDENWRAA